MLQDYKQNLLMSVWFVNQNYQSSVVVQSRIGWAVMSIKTFMLSCLNILDLISLVDQPANRP